MGREKSRADSDFICGAHGGNQYLTHQIVIGNFVELRKSCQPLPKRLLSQWLQVANLAWRSVVVVVESFGK